MMSSDSNISISSPKATENEDGRTVTIFLLGTGSNKDDWKNPIYPNGELVSTLLHNVEGTENIDYAYANGPGSGNKDDAERWTQPTNSSQQKQLLRGDGIEENLEHIIAVLEGRRKWWPEGHEQKQPQRDANLKPITKINIVSWSRGAASAIALSNKIYERQHAERPSLQSIKEINICAIDPVPGFGSSSRHNSRLSPLVKDYLGIYSLHERSFGFSYVIPPKHPNAETNVEHTFMPGYHATLVGNDKTHAGEFIEGYDLSTVSKIVRDKAEKFLMKHGTEFKFGTTLNYTHKEVLALYKTVRKNLLGYKEFKESAYTVSQFFEKSRKAVIYENYINNTPSSQLSDYAACKQARKCGYVNSHHAELERKFLKNKYGKYFIYVEKAHIMKFHFSKYVAKNFRDILNLYANDNEFLKNTNGTSIDEKKHNSIKTFYAIIEMLDEFLKNIDSATNESQTENILENFKNKFTQTVLAYLEADEKTNLYNKSFTQLLEDTLINVHWDNSCKEQLKKKQKARELTEKQTIEALTSVAPVNW